MGGRERLDVENTFPNASECKNGCYLADTSNHCQQLTRKKYKFRKQEVCQSLPLWIREIQW